jgi:Sec-independent protein translocase protein TatA
MTFLGATRDEILFVALIIILVVVAPKIPKLGEWIGARFESGREKSHDKDGAKPGSAEGKSGDKGS